MSPGGSLNFNVPLTPNAINGGKESFSASPPAPTLELPPKPKGSKKESSKLSRLPTRRELFGGAIIMMLPETYEDVSVLREVPDHQEVFVDRDSEVSLIVELLEHDGTVGDEQAAQHYFKDLASFNDVRLGSYIPFILHLHDHIFRCPSLITTHHHSSPLITTHHHSSPLIITHHHSLSLITHHRRKTLVPWTSVASSPTRPSCRLSRWIRGGVSGASLWGDRR